ncbi:MAG TPA: hypothetical protein VHA73_05450 [Acidimicrobiales bacterium]|jgi:lincosamide nucleotidyltransferase A/C/D/E|nr:hypothetical protein [Acidimicrobiales bacterium]
MQLGDVLRVLGALRGAGLAVWLDGGYGVDALLGTQTRDHSDLDIVIELAHVNDVRDALNRLGFSLAEDYLPTRAVLRAADGRSIDLHPVTFDEHGTGWQHAASPHGTDCPYPAEGFGEGRVTGDAVPCLTATLQVAHHSGYPPATSTAKTWPRSPPPPASSCPRSTPRPEHPGPAAAPSHPVARRLSAACGVARVRERRRQTNDPEPGSNDNQANDEQTRPVPTTMKKSWKEGAHTGTRCGYRRS